MSKIKPSKRELAARQEAYMELAKGKQLKISQNHPTDSNAKPGYHRAKVRAKL